MDLPRALDDTKIELYNSCFLGVHLTALLSVMSAVRPVEDVSLLEVKQHYNILTNVNKELGDIKVTKKKKRNLMKEVTETICQNKAT